MRMKATACSGDGDESGIVRVGPRVRNSVTLGIFEPLRIPAMPNTRTLYSYWRSSAAYRVRIALNLKGMDYAIAPVHLLRDGGEQHHDDYRRLNPQQLIPALVDGKHVLRESMAHGSTLNVDPENIDGSYYGGGYSDRWRVYDRENEECVDCRAPIARIVQGGRSTYFCPVCQQK